MGLGMGTLVLGFLPGLMRLLIFLLVTGFMVAPWVWFIHFLEKHFDKFKRTRECGYLLRESGGVFLKELACDGH